ncbi:hypothetical protein ANCCAN_13291 [Ancylostoma caninum]|uniref:G-protein coupled receptors family 1 profile domain-containing protein n=1 Tax=Ancylostoma caninum TaxID=29170 RepID=A0A368G8N6_ANCCA|nr:hypothetical protein ANCCAN_13291 [Ancylostoma caninum]
MLVQETEPGYSTITYAYIAPVIIVCGILGDVLTVVTLTHPLLRKSTIVYTYLTLLAMTDLANALMGASVWIVVFLTLSQYMAVCRPFAYGLRSRKVCFILFSLAYIFNFCIYAPWAVKKEVHNLRQIIGKDILPDNVCPFIVCDTRRADWFMMYETVRELISRIFPFFLVAYMNAKILITYRNTKKDRMLRLTNSQKRFVFEKSERIFRAIVNLLEFTKFALNFYFYCLINPDIRRICMHVIMCKKISRPPRVKGQPTTPISFYTRYDIATFIETFCNVSYGS